MMKKTIPFIALTLFAAALSCTAPSLQEQKTVKKQIKTAAASDKSPFSQGIDVNGLVFLSGTLGVDAATGTLAGDDVVSQLTQIVANISEVLKEAGCSINDVVKTNVFLTNMQDYAAMNEAYLKLFQAPYPARTCVEISALPRAGAVIEVEIIAAKP